MNVARDLARLTPVRLAAILCALVALAGCQTSETAATAATEAVGTAEAPGATEPSDRVTVGSGAVSVALFVDSLVDARVAADQRDGASLAVQDVGGGNVALTVFDLKGNWENLDDRAGEALAAGGRLFVGPSSIGQMAALKKLDRTRRPPIIMLAPAATAPQPGVFALISDEIDGAVEAARYAIGSGRPNILAISETAVPVADAERIGAGVEALGGLFEGVLVGAEDVTSPTGREKIAAADAVLFLGKSPRIVRTAFRATGAQKQKAWLFAMPDLSRDLYHDFEGAYVAALDQRGLEQVSKRFSAAYGRPLSAEAAYAYDAVAIGAGITRAKGGAEIPPAALQAKAGFAGTTGPFRFTADGRVERRFAIYRIKSGTLTLHDAAPGSF